MNNFLMAFSPNLTVLVLSTMCGLIVSYIFMTKLFPTIVPSSFQFSRNYYLLGLVFSILGTLVCLNMEVESAPYIPYEMDTDDDPPIIIPSTVWEKPKPILPPPPPEVTKLEVPVVPPKIVPIDKLETVIDDQPEIKDLVESKEHYNVDSMITATKSVEPEIVRDETPEIEIHKFVEQMPRFPGCEEIDGNIDAKKTCAEKKLLEFIYDNLKYPAMAREINVEGTVTAQFVVDRDGSVIDIKIVRGLPGGLSKATSDAISKMNEMDEKWTPGKQGGKAVKVLFTLPIRFKLD